MAQTTPVDYDDYVSITLSKRELQDLLKMQFASYDHSDKMGYPAYLAMTTKLMDALKQAH
jgi:hypothetical protein